MIKLIVSLLIPQLAGFLGALATTPSIKSWYSHLNKPSFNPPNWLFGPVWTLLFLLMGISLYLVWRQGNTSAALTIFFVQLALNLLWSILFFGLHQPTLAFLEIIVLWLAILATILKFYPISNLAAYLLIPYLLWVSFAGFLNFTIARLNPVLK